MLNVNRRFVWILFLVSDFAEDKFITKRWDAWVKLKVLELVPLSQMCPEKSRSVSRVEWFAVRVLRQMRFEKLRCMKRIEGFWVCFLGQMGHEKTKCLRKVDGFGVGVLGQVRHETARLLKRIDGFGVFFLGQMCHKKLRSVRRFEGFVVSVVCHLRLTNRDKWGELRVLEYALRVDASQINLLAFWKRFCA